MFDFFVFGIFSVFIGRYLEMVAKLKFEEKPDYEKFRSLCRQGLKEAGYPDDGKLVFTGSAAAGGSKASPRKKSSTVAVVPTILLNDESENKNSRKQKIKNSSKREPCSPKVSNRWVSVVIFQ